MGIELIELTEPSDTLNYKPFFKHCILQNILQVFLFFIFVWNKIFCSKNSAVFYIFGLLALARRVLWNRICPSFRPSVCSSVCPGIFVELYHMIFLNFGMMQETHMKLCMTELDFAEKNFLSPKLGKCAINGFFWLYWKILSLIFTEFVI